ncbi:MAG: DUF6262 family protein [Propionicimonas sp.]
MGADNTDNLINAARNRTAITRRKVTMAIRRLDAAAATITYQSLAREAGVSRSWLYSQPDIRELIDHHRAGHPEPPGPASPPPRQRPSAASLQTRLEVAAARIRELQQDNQRLREALAQALADTREPTRTATRRQTNSTPRAASGLTPVSDTVHQAKPQLKSQICGPDSR